MYIAGPVLKMAQGNQYNPVHTNLYSNLARAALATRNRATDVANRFMGHWLISHAIPMHLIPDSSPIFVCGFFATMCALFGPNLFATAAKHS